MSELQQNIFTKLRGVAPGAFAFWDGFRWETTDGPSDGDSVIWNDANKEWVPGLPAASGLKMLASFSGDTAPVDDTTMKQITIQKLSAPPTNAAYIAFSNNPGADTFYLVMEEG